MRIAGDAQVPHRRIDRCRRHRLPRPSTARLSARGYLTQDFGVDPGSRPTTARYLAGLQGPGRARRAARRRTTSRPAQAGQPVGGAQEGRLFAGILRRHAASGADRKGADRPAPAEGSSSTSRRRARPEERNRCNNLLAAIGENMVGFLSTHIVDDVTELGSRVRQRCMVERSEFVAERTRRPR